MRRVQLRDYFVGVGIKRLSLMDAEPLRSNLVAGGEESSYRNSGVGIQASGKLNLSKEIYSPICFF